MASENHNKKPLVIERRRGKERKKTPRLTKTYEVKIIPATIGVVMETEEPPKKRVAAYCRVSTDQEAQETSLEEQMAHFNTVIAEHSDWELAGIYADEGISGTQVKYRVQFQQMIEDARLKVVYENGGIYLDTDVELLRKPDFLLENQCYIGIQQPESLCTTGLGFGAEKSSPVVKKMMECYDTIEFSDQAKNTFACPWLNNRVIRSFGKVNDDEITHLHGVTVYPSKFFDPLSTGNTKNLLCDDTVSIHHYAATWAGNKQRWKRKVVRIIGEENVLKIKEILVRNRR